MTLDALGLLLWRRRLVVAGMALLGALCAVALTLVTPKVYAATAVSFVTAVPAPDKGASYESAQFAVSRARSYPPLLRSPEVISGVRQELGLAMSDAEMGQHLSAENPADTILLQIVAEASTPDLASTMANAAARHLAAEVKDLETGGQKRASPIDIQLAVPATPPTAPTRPRMSVNVVLGVVAGGVAGVLIALIGEARRTVTARGRRMAAPADATDPGIASKR